MEKIKAFIRLSEETKELREKLANQLINSNYLNSEMDKATDLISKMEECAIESGVLAIREKNGEKIVQVDYEKFIEVTDEEQRIAGTVEDHTSFLYKHFSAQIEGVKLVTVDSVWKGIENASA